MSSESWLKLTEEELESVDIAEVNLSLAEGLPGSEDLNVDAMLGRIDDWAAIVEHDTIRAYRQRRRPEYADLSDNEFRVLAMVTTLQQKLGAKYSLATLERDVDASDPRTYFIQGLLTGHGGTCVSMPILYAAVGRRLGYPIKLCFAMEHVFCRWEDAAGERFNIEATSPGYVSHPDDEYLVWPKPLSDCELQTGRFLRALSPREELALCFDTRGHCWLDNLCTMQALEAYQNAHRCAPHDNTYAIHHDVAVVIHRALLELQWQAEITPNENRLSMPAPKDAIEKELYRLASEQFSRIISIHKAKQRRVAVQRLFEQGYTNDWSHPAR